MSHVATPAAHGLNILQQPIEGRWLRFYEVSTGVVVAGVDIEMPLTEV